MARRLTEEEAKNYQPENNQEELPSCLAAHTQQTQEQDELSGLSESERLSFLYEQYQEKRRFKPGQLVQWKLGMRYRELPNYKQPAVVIQHLNKPIIFTQVESGSPYYREPLDLIIGVVDESGDFLRMHADSQRFELFTPEAETP